MKKILYTMICLMALAGALVYGAGQSDAAADSGSADREEVEISYWATTGEQQNYERLAASFEARHPDYRVKMNQHASTEEFWNALPIAIAAQAGPDLIAFTDEGASEYIAKKVVTPLDDLMEEVSFDRSVIIDSLWKGWTFEGKTYGVPRDAATSMLFINKGLFDATGIAGLPENMEELFAAARAMTRDNVYGICINLHEFHITQYVHAFGGGWGFGKTISAKANAEALQFIVEMYKEGVAVTPSVLGASWDGEVFSQEKAAISTGGAWYIGYLNEANPDLEYYILPIPEGTIPSQSAFSGGLSILDQSDNKTGAMLYIQNTLTQENQRETMNALGIPSSRNDLMDEFLVNYPQLKPIFYSLGEKGLPFAYPGETRNFNTNLLKNLEKVIFAGDDTPMKDILADLQDEFGL